MGTCGYISESIWLTYIHVLEGSVSPSIIIRNHRLLAMAKVDLNYNPTILKHCSFPCPAFQVKVYSVKAKDSS